MFTNKWPVGRWQFKKKEKIRTEFSTKSKYRLKMKEILENEVG